MTTIDKLSKFAPSTKISINPLCFLSGDNVMLSCTCKTVKLRIIDFDNISQRCGDCTECNELSDFNPRPDCPEDKCREWHDLRADDVREAGFLTYQLVKVPTAVSRKPMPPVDTMIKEVSFCLI